MTYADVLKYCLSLPDTKKHYNSDKGNAFSLKVGNEPFAYFETGAPIQWQFVVRVTPALFDQLHRPPQVKKTEKEKGHWIIITRVENFDETQLKDLIQWSYQQAVAV
jgi:predicted DNA-binding protein (MmcQ/YjbR family)